MHYKVGTRQANISRIESGLANPTLTLIAKITKALDVNIRYDDFVAIPQDENLYRNLFTRTNRATSQPTYQYTVAASGETILNEEMKV